MKAEIEVISDAVCPWCYVGQKRLDKALRTLAGQVEAEVSWRPFELNPDTPPQGLDREAHLARKYGLDRVRQMGEHLTRVAAADGIEFHFERVQRIPNTFNAHRLVWLAGPHQNEVVTRLFRAYFEDGRDIGDRRVLLDLGIESGLDPLAVQTMLATDQGVQQVRAEETLALRLGVNAVPTFLVNGHLVASGAQPPEVLARAIQEVVLATVSGAVCSPDGC